MARNVCSPTQGRPFDLDWRSNKEEESYAFDGWTTLLLLLLLRWWLGYHLGGEHESWGQWTSLLLDDDVDVDVDVDVDGNNNDNDDDDVDNTNSEDQEEEKKKEEW